MDRIPANRPAPIVGTFAANNLFIGMRVFDMSSGSPVQITGQPGQTNDVYPMTNVPSSLSYQALFTGLNQKGYLFLLNGYTDGTYTAIDGAVPEQSLSAFCSIVSPLIVQKLKVLVGCQNQALQDSVVAPQNSDLNLLLGFFDEDGSPLDISAAVAISFAVLEADDSTVLSKSLGSGISLVEGYPNQVLVSLLAADLALLPTGDSDLDIGLSINGSAFNFNLYGALNVEPLVTS